MLSNSANPLTGRDRNISLTAVIVSAFFVGAAFGLGYPVAALKVTGSGAPEWVVGLIGAAPSLAIFLMLPFMPKIVRRTGAADALLYSGLGGAGCYLALMLTDDTLAWIVIRFVMGANIGMWWLVSQTWVAVISDEATRGRVLALYVMAFSSGMAACPAALEYADVAGPVPLLAGALVSALTIIPAIVARNIAPAVDDIGSDTSSVRQALTWAPMAMAGSFLNGYIELIHMGLLPNAGLASGLDQTAALRLLTLFLVGALTMQLPFGWLTDKLPPKPLALVVTGLLGIACAALPLALTDGVLSAVVAYAIGGMIYGLYTVCLAIVSDIKDVPDAGASNAAFIMCYQAGGVLGPLMTGAAMSVSPVPGFAAVQVAGIVVIALVMCGTLYRGRQRAP